MSEPLELQLPPGRSLDAVSVDEHQLYVQTALAGAVVDQAEGLTFPSLERLCSRFGLNRVTAWQMRSTLVHTGHLVQLGLFYMTAHPQNRNETKTTGGENA